MFLIWHMHCFSRACNTQLWRVAEWLERKKALVRRAAVAKVVEARAVVVVAHPAAVVVARAVVDLPAAKAVAAVVAVSPAADRVVVVAAVASLAVVVVVVNPVAAVVAVSPAAAAVARVVEARAVAVVDAHPAAAGVVDKVVAVAVVVRPEVEAEDKAVVVKEAVVVAVRPEAVAEAAETASSFIQSGASRSRGAPFFIDALSHPPPVVAAVDHSTARDLVPAAQLALAGRRERYSFAGLSTRLGDHSRPQRSAQHRALRVVDSRDDVPESRSHRRRRQLD
jgi:hypothetical protein